jgi:hypothetical protein
MRESWTFSSTFATNGTTATSLHESTLALALKLALKHESPLALALKHESTLALALKLALKLPLSYFEHLY